MVLAQDIGLAITCDPDPLTPQGEALCLVAGRRTYAWRRGHFLTHRGRIQISAGMDARTDVLSSHQCGAPVPLMLLDRERMRKRYRPAEVLPDDPPF